MWVVLPGLAQVARLVAEGLVAELQLVLVMVLLIPVALGLLGLVVGPV